MRLYYKELTLLLSIIFLVINASSQGPGQRPARVSGLRSDTGIHQFNAPPKIPSQPKPYKDIITSKAITSNGFFKVHKEDDKYFFEIPNGYLDRDILIVARIIKAPNKTVDSKNRATGYSNDEIGESVVTFSKGPKNKIFLKQKSVVETTYDSNGEGLSKAILNNSIDPIFSSFDIKAYTPDSTATVIDMTDYLNGDNDLFFFDKTMKKRMGGLGALEADRSFVLEIKSFPINIEIKTLKTYKTSESGSLTYELNSSMVLLPEKPMQPRYYDPRVGYFSNKVIDYDVSGINDQIKGYVARWRLEPKPEDMDRYKRGELVEPQKPIVIYIDPATPKKWVPYLIAGINDWQVAFEQAGFKNAILAKEAPVDDSTWSLENALYSALVYKPSNIPNASGPHISDPRSGEIIETHINWYHNVMSLVYSWYFVQCSNVDPRARKPYFDDDLMGKLIRFVSSHEVGHTLGLMHNFGSSSTVPVELLRNKAWVEANGHTPSIMDYARFNYVAQPEDHIGEKGLFPRIGAYDKWAIQWGYKLIPDAGSAEQELPILNQWIMDSLKTNKFLVYGAQGAPDPRDQSEVLSDNPMAANTYGIKNLKAILPHIIEWTKEPNKRYENSKEMYKQIFDQYQRYVRHVSAYLNQNYITYEFSAQPKLEMVPMDKQKEALDFLNEQVLKTPIWLVGDSNMFGNYGYLPRIFTLLQEEVVNSTLISNSTLEHIFLYKQYYKDAFSIDEYLKILTNNILSELIAGKPVNEYQRKDLQRIYINALCGKIDPSIKSIIRLGPMISVVSSNMDKNSVVVSYVKDYINSLILEMKKFALIQKDPDTKNHIKDLQERLEKAIKASKYKKKK